MSADQRDIIALFRRLGCRVYSLSQDRPSRQTPGLPDLLVCHPRFSAPLAWETKLPGDRVRPAQVEFQDHWLDSHGLHGWGDFPAAQQKLLELGLIR